VDRDDLKERVKQEFFSYYRGKDIQECLAEVDRLYQREMQRLSLTHLEWWSKQLLALAKDPKFELPHSTSVIHLLHEFKQYLEGLEPEEVG
jgi:hypothetical protein